MKNRVPVGGVYDLCIYSCLIPSFLLGIRRAHNASTIIVSIIETDNLVLKQRCMLLPRSGPRDVEFGRSALIDFVRSWLHRIFAYAPILFQEQPFEVTVPLDSLVRSRETMRAFRLVTILFVFYCSADAFSVATRRSFGGLVAAGILTPFVFQAPDARSEGTVPMLQRLIYLYIR
jgi:hypothetical protein